MRLVRIGEQPTSVSGHSTQSGGSIIVINIGIIPEIFTMIKELKGFVFMCINVCLQICVPGAQGGTRVIVGCKPPCESRN